MGQERWSSIWDGRRRPPLAAYPRLGGAGRTSPPIWPCSGWGLPCHHCYQWCGGLLPHRFTLTRSQSGRFLFCGPIRRLAAPRRYLAAYPVELGLSSDTLRHPRPSCPTSGCNIAGRPGRGEVTGSKWLNSACMPHPRQSPLRLLQKWKQCRIGSLPLCQHLTILLPGFGSAAQPLVGGTPEKPDPAQHAPA